MCYCVCSQWTGVLSVVHEGPAVERVMCVIVCVVNGQDVGLTGDSADTSTTHRRGHVDIGRRR